MVRTWRYFCCRCLAAVGALSMLSLSAAQSLEVGDDGRQIVSHEVLFRCDLGDPNTTLALPTKQFGHAFRILTGHSVNDTWYVARDIAPGGSRSVLTLIADLKSLNPTAVHAEPNIVLSLQGSNAFAKIFDSRTFGGTTTPTFPPGDASNKDAFGIAVLDSGVATPADIRFTNAFWPHRAQPFDLIVEGQPYTCPPNAVGIDVTKIDPPGSKASDVEAFNPVDEEGHGTHCGSLAADFVRVSSHLGYIVPCKIVRAGNATARWLMDAIEFIVQANASEASSCKIRIISLSWGGDDPSDALYSAIKLARDNGILVVCSAGNGHESSDLYARYPAAYSQPSVSTDNLNTVLPPLDNILTVASIDDQDRLARSSNYGLNSVLVAAKGEWVECDSFEGSNPRDRFSGTSAAAAVASGEASVVLTSDPKLSYQQLKWLLVRTAKQIHPSLDHFVLSQGKISTSDAISALSSTTVKMPSHQVFAWPGFLKIKRGDSRTVNVHVESINRFRGRLNLSAAVNKAESPSPSPGFHVELSTPHIDVDDTFREVNLSVSTDKSTLPGLYFILIHAASGKTGSDTVLEISVY